jgi:hypothetical protein
MARSSQTEIFMGMGHERQEWPLLETAQVWTDNLQELKQRGVMTDDDLHELERRYGYWGAHLALSYGRPIWLARQGHIEESKQKVFEYARQVTRPRHTMRC